MESIKKYYRNNLKRYGINSHESVGWDERHFQEKRFEYLAQIGNLKGKRVLDWGSGLGDFYGYLEKQKIGCSYVGLELVPELMKVAEKKYPQAKFVEADGVEVYSKKVDFIIASGIFNVRNGIQSKKYFEYVSGKLQKAFERCREGLAINFLNRDLADWDFEFEAFLISEKQVAELKTLLKPRKFKNILDPDLEGEYTLHFMK